MDAVPAHSTPAVTLQDVGVERLRRLCRAVELSDAEPIAVFKRLVSPWGGRQISKPAAWPSEVTDDHTPFELSLALGAGPEVRVMVEPLSPSPSLRTNAKATISLLHSLATDFELDLGRLHRVQDLFLPELPRGAFACWVAAEFAATRSPHFKIYLNPFAQGVDYARALVEEALLRLGFISAWPFVARVLARRGADLDELMYLSLDLSPGRHARVKIYARHRRCTVAELEAAASGSTAHRKGDIAHLIRTIVPGRERFDGRAPFTCYAFVADGGGRPSAVTTHFPINGYARDDEAVQTRVAAYLDQVGLPANVYRSALQAVATRPLANGVGIQSYVSIRRHHGRPRLTVYLPIEAYRPGTIAPPPRSTPPDALRGHLGRVDRDNIRFDPFIRRLAREPVDPGHLRTLVDNHETAMARALPQLTDAATRGVHDPLLRSHGLRLSDLRENNGEGALARSRTCSPSDDPGISAIACAESQLAPARHLASAIADLISSEDSQVARGVLVACIFADCQWIEFLDEQGSRWSDEVRREFAVSSARRRAALARRSAAIQLVESASSEALFAMIPGVRTFWRRFSLFYADLYARCYSPRSAVIGPGPEMGLSTGNGESHAVESRAVEGGTTNRALSSVRAPWNARGVGRQRQPGT